MKVIIFLTLIALVAAAPKVPKLSFRNLYKDTKLVLKVKPSPHIIGGTEAEPHSIPAQAFLEIYSENSGWYCGGSLISENYVLTAGHCGDGGIRAVVTLGAHQLSQPSQGEISVEATTIVVHSEYDATLIINDIAVIELPKPITLSDIIAPIGLASDPDATFVDETARISGWGLTDGFDTNLSDVLNYVDVRVITNEECEQDLGEVISSIVCTSGNDKTGSCNGDSGGPLVVDGVQIGIVSYGIRYCLPGFASAFTRVTSFRDWIAENTDVQL